MSTEPTRDGERQSDLAVMGVDEYKQKRRLERILDDIDAIGNKSRESWDKYVSGGIDFNGKNVTVQRNVKEAIWDCRQMLEDYAESVDGRDEYWWGDPNDPIGVIEQYRDPDIVIVGLENFLYQPETWFEEWTESKKPRNLPRETVTRRIEHTVPEVLSRDAASRLLKFLSKERGIELSTEQKEIEVHAEPW
jgi:hypothetical protein